MLYKSSKLIKNAKISPEVYLVKAEDILEEITKEKELEKEIKDIQEEKISEVELNREKEKILNLESKAKELEEKISILEKEIVNRQNLLKETEQKLNILKEELKKTEEKIEEIKNSAYREGFEEGKTKGKEEVINRYKTLERIIEEVLKEKEKILIDSEKELVKLALEISKKIVKEEIKLNEDVILNITRSALDKLVEREKIEIKVNPEEVEKIKELEREFPKYGIKKWEIIPDPSIEKGGCIVVSGNTYFDATISSQEEEVRNILG